MYYTYMLRCKDNSIYTGITKNLNERMEEHFLKEKNGAKYTKSHEALRLEAAWMSKEKSAAYKLEYHIKNLSKIEKEKIITCSRINELLKGKIDSRKYRRVKLSESIDMKFLLL